MASALFREPNRARWLGVRPGHDGSQIVKWDDAVNIETAVLYTVPANRVLLIFEWFVNMRGAATNVSIFYIRDVLDAMWLRLSYHYFVAVADLSGGCGLYVPIEVPEGYDVCVLNTVASSYTYAQFHGMLVDT